MHRQRSVNTAASLSGPRLHLAVLGRPEVWLDGQLCTSLSSQKARALLFYLVMEAEQAHTRRVLAGLFWPQQADTQALHSLRQALLLIRRALEPVAAPDMPFLLVSRARVQFNTASAYSLDTARFLAVVATPADAPAALDTRSEAAALYRGNFLEQFVLEDCEAFEEWAAHKREHLHTLAIDLFETLWTAYEQRGVYDQALDLARRALALEPWHEEAHRCLMRVYAARGQRSAALAQYRSCCEILLRELKMEPAAATTHLYAQIKASVPAHAHPAPRRATLPAQPTPLIGRDIELEQVVHLLGTSACRLLTLTGPGGIGKTRLAIEAARTLSSAYRHGVCVVYLATVSTPALLENALAAALDISLVHNEEPRMLLLNYLREKELLLVLDNFDHLLSGVPLLVALLEYAPEVRLLVTSRERLNSRWEWLLPVPGLACPTPDNEHPAAIIPAVQLFVDCAQRAAPGFVPTADDLQHIAAICQQAEGLPLTLELAATLVHSLPCATIASRLAQTPASIGTNWQDMPPRHRSLQAVFDYSWQFLTPAAQHVLCGLTLLRGSFLREAAEHITEANAPLLISLVHKSLVQALPDGRYQLHDIVRQFAHERLASLPSVARTAAARHCVYFLTQLQHDSRDFASHRQHTALERTSSHIDDIRAAWRYALDHGSLDTLRDALDGLYEFLLLRGWYHEGVETFTQASAALHTRTQHQASQQLQIRLHVRQARFDALLGYYDKADALLHASLARLETLGDACELGLAYSILAMTAYYRGTYTTAVRWAAQSLAAYHRAGDLNGVALAHQDQGDVFFQMGKYAAALKHYQQSRTFYQQSGHYSGLAAVLNGLGITEEMLGNYHDARAHLHEAQQLYTTLGDRWGVVRVLGNLGNMAHSVGDLPYAQQLCSESLAICTEMGNRFGIAFLLNVLGDIARWQGDYARAHHLQQQSYALSEELGDQAGQGFALLSMGALAHVQQHPAAAQQLTQALDLFVAAESHWGMAAAHKAMAALARQEARLSEAYDHIHTALLLAVESNALPQQLALLAELAALLSAQGKATQALELVAFVLHHPIREYATQLEAEQLAQTLRATLSTQVVAQCEARGRAQQLDDAIRMALALRPTPRQARRAE